MPSWKSFAEPEKVWLPRRLTGAAREELLGILATLPACTTSLRGPVDSVVACSDASEVGLGVSRSVRLSELG